MSNCEILINRLTTRERQIFMLIVRGFTNFEISQEIGITAATVKIHRSNIYRKISANSLKEVFEIFKVRPTAIEINEET